MGLFSIGRKGKITSKSAINIVDLEFPSVDMDKITFISYYLLEYVKKLINSGIDPLKITMIFNAGEATEQVYNNDLVRKSIEAILQLGVSIKFIAGPVLESFYYDLKKDYYLDRHVILTWAGKYPRQFRLYKRIQEGKDIARNHKFYLFNDTKEIMLHADVNNLTTKNRGLKHKLNIVRGYKKDIDLEINTIMMELEDADNGKSILYSTFLPNGDLKNRFPIRADTKLGNIFNFYQFVIFLFTLLFVGAIGFLSLIR